jgi:hypothetical protein
VEGVALRNLSKCANFGLVVDILPVSTLYGRVLHGYPERSTIPLSEKYALLASLLLYLSDLAYSYA